MGQVHSKELFHRQRLSVILKSGCFLGQSELGQILKISKRQSTGLQVLLPIKRTIYRIALERVLILPVLTN